MEVSSTEGVALPPRKHPLLRSPAAGPGGMRRPAGAVPVPPGKLAKTRDADNRGIRPTAQSLGSRTCAHEGMARALVATSPDERCSTLKRAFCEAPGEAKVNPYVLERYRKRGQGGHRFAPDSACITLH